jgi:hypothetical protein
MATAALLRARAATLSGPVVALAGWVTVLVAAIWWGQLVQREVRLHVGSLPPFSGQARLAVPVGLLPAVVLALAAAVLAPAAARRLPWPLFLAAASLTAAAWAVALAVADGTSALTAPLTRPEDYRAALPALRDGVGSFLHTYVDALPSYPIHVRGHPPGAVLAVDGLDRLGLRGAGWTAAVVVAAGSSAVAAVAIAARAVAGEETARRAVPFLVLAPSALWVATSLDALFLGVSAWGLALLALAARKPLLALPAGALLGLTLFLSYGLLPLGAVAAAIGWRWPRVLALAAGAAATVVVGFAAAGFWWPAGVAATHAQWARGLGSDRPYGYFLLGDLALFAVLVGPAGAAALTALRDRRLWLVVAAALLAVGASDLGGFSRGEVERIWLPFAPWVLVAAAALPHPRRWLAAQAAVALTVPAVLVLSW